MEEKKEEVTLIKKLFSKKDREISKIKSEMELLELQIEKAKLERSLEQVRTTPLNHSVLDQELKKEKKDG